MQTPAARACTRVSAQRHPRRIAASFGNSVGTACAYVTAVTSLLADCAPGLLNPPARARSKLRLLDGTLANVAGSATAVRTTRPSTVGTT